uniref:Uncharacterized protein n=1 Tax=Oryza nivara TaxID=4536 RepID=A0A0E0HB69_ORYNI
MAAFTDFPPPVAAAAICSKIASCCTRRRTLSARVGGGGEKNREGRGKKGALRAAAGVQMWPLTRRATAAASHARQPGESHPDKQADLQVVRRRVHHHGGRGDRRAGVRQRGGRDRVSSPSNASGYLGHPLTSREVFCARLPGKDVGSSCYVCAGDRGVVVRGAERYLYVIGRSADVLALDVDSDQRVRARLRLPTQHHAAPSTPLTTARRPHHLLCHSRCRHLLLLSRLTPVVSAPAAGWLAKTEEKRAR